MTQGDRSSSNQTNTGPQDPELFGPRAAIEAALIGAFISGGKLTFDVAMKVVDHLKSKTPLAVQVLDSRKDGNDGVIYLRLTNLTGHGLCVFKIVSTRPAVSQPQVERLLEVSEPTPGGGWGSKVISPQSPTMPFVIPPTESQDVRLRFDLNATKKEIHNALYGVAKIHYEVLAGKDPDDEEVTFRFREDAPVESSFAASRIPRK